MKHGDFLSTFYDLRFIQRRKPFFFGVGEGRFFASFLYEQIANNVVNVTTLPETNIAPENNPLEKEIPIGNHHY